MSEHKTHVIPWYTGWSIDGLVLAVLASIGILGIVATGKLERPLAEAPDVTIEQLRPTEPEIAPESKPVIPEIIPQDPEIVDEKKLKEEPSERVLETENGVALITLMGNQLNDGFWYVSEHANVNSFYSADWKRANISVSSDGTALSVRRDPSNARGYTAAEIKSRPAYGFGTYEAVMRPARGSGIVSAFFTYIGPYTGDPHDEIDFEFLGADLTKVYLNYWRDGKRGDYQTIDLGFDAGDAPHLYAFEWREDGIVWKVDGKVIYQTAPGDVRIPSTFGQAFFSIWTGDESMQGWHGPPTFEDGAQSEISCFSFVPQGGVGRTCGHFYLDKVTQPARAADP